MTSNGSGGGRRVSSDPPDWPGPIFTWGGAYALYLLAYTSAIRISSAMGMGSALLAGIANSLPEALAVPVVLRLAEAAPSRRNRLWLIALAPVFVLWCVLGATFGLMAMRAWEGQGWHLPQDNRNVAWKALLSLLVFAVLAGFGRSRFHVRQAKEASIRALRAETLRAEARLAVLRAQLNPHFILNVLHSLVGLAERDAPATANALERLGTTLRYALRVQSAASDRVALRDELAFTREYLELERLRLGTRLSTRFTIDDAALGRVVPPFVLQPLVENAVIHAIASRAAGGVVSISIAQEAEALVLRVEDDGAWDSRAEPFRKEGLGLPLLRSRLDALYGTSGTLRIERSSLGGFSASVRLVGEPGFLEEDFS
ncbi:MAG: histidine kinase [Thermoanaerobaculia bacterium]